MEESREIDERLADAERLLGNLLGSRHRLRLAGQKNKWYGKGRSLAPEEVMLYKIQEITFEEKYPQRDAMENVLGSFRGIDGISFVYIILGDTDRINIYLGVAEDKLGDYEPKFNSTTFGGELLRPAFQGNFRGSVVEPLSPKEQEKVLARLRCQNNGKPLRYMGLIEGVPGIDEDAENFQGAERLIDVMFCNQSSAGESDAAVVPFGMVVIARPYTEQEIEEVTDRLYDIAERLTLLLRHSVRRSRGDSTTHSENDGTQRSYGSQESKSYTKLFNRTDSRDSRRDDSRQLQRSESKGGSSEASNGTNWQNTSSSSQGERNCSSESDQTNEGKSHRDTEQHSENEAFHTGLTYSEGKQHSVQDGENDSRSKTDSYSRSKSDSTAEQHSESTAIDEQAEVERKAVADWVKYFDEVLFPRIDNAEGNGLFQVCTYIFADKKATRYRLASTIQSLYSGPKGNKGSLFFTPLDAKKDAGCIEALQNLQIPTVNRDCEATAECAAAFSRWENPQRHEACCGSWLSATDGICARAF